MNPLELRLIAYAIVTLFLLGGAGWAGHRLTALHYEAIISRNQIAQDQAVLAQQTKALAVLQVQQAATQAAEKQYADLKSTSDGLSQRLADSVSNYAALHRGIMSATSAATAAADAASQGAKRDSELAGLVRQATEACQGDAAELTALQTWARKQQK